MATNIPSFLSDEEFRLLPSDAARVAEKAEEFIRELREQLEVVRAQADAKTITEEQNCALLEQKYATLYSEFTRLQYENTHLTASTEKCLSELANAQTEKHQLHIKSIGKDGEVEKLTLEAAERQKSLRQLSDLVVQKDAEINERNATIQCYIEKIAQLSGNNSSKDSKLHEMEAELMHCQAACSRLTQEKELLEKQNVWLDDELTTKSNNLFELRKRQMDAEADTFGKISELERQVKELSVALNHSKERVKEQELRVKSLEKELFSSKDAATANEEHFNAELSTVNKLVELYKESSDEWSKKAGELEGVIKALETHLAQVENDYKEKLERETSLRTDLEKELADLNVKVEKCEAELENTRKANESSLLPWTISPISTCVQEPVISEAGSDISQVIVPRIAAGVSGTALAASLLRDGWSLTKMYEKYQEASDALRHEKWGRKHAEAVLERVLHEIEDKAEIILEERVEHERMLEAYTTMDQRLQQALFEHDNYENSLRKLKGELRKHEREFSIAQKEITDLQKQVTILLKECQYIQLRCGGNLQVHVEDNLTAVSSASDELFNADTTISDNNLTFKDINELVEQNSKLRSLVHRLSIDEEKNEAELRENFQIQLQRAADDAASKVEVVLKRSEEQASMIESLHSSVAMYKRLYEEEHKFRTLSHASPIAISDNGKKDLMLLFEGSQEVSKKAYEQLGSRARTLEEDIARLSTELISARAERDKMSLEASFAKERLDCFMKEFDHQRAENNSVSVRNMELTHLLIDYQKKVRESSASLQDAEQNSRKLSMEVSILKHEREILVSSEKRMSDEVQNLMERIHRLQSSLDTIQSAEEVRENARAIERKKHDEYLKKVESDWAEAKRDLHEERDRIRALTIEKERAIETSMRHLEDMKNELASAWQAFATAESRASVAEARCSDLNAKIQSYGKQVITEVAKDEVSVLSTNEISLDLWKAKEELVKVKDEAHASKEYMLQYKELARTNEIALKQMELAHEDYKSEAVKMKRVLEDQVHSLQNQISEFEQKYMLKCEEVVSITEDKEKALSSAMVDTSRLMDEVAEKVKMIGELEIQVSFLKDDLEKEQKRGRTAQENYERQIILQSETIQELTNTSKELSLMQTEISRLHKLVDAHKTEKDFLKLSWETEKSEMQQMKNDTERKYSEMNEQNKILHNRLEALHVRLAENDKNSVGLLSVSSKEDGDLQKVIGYLRRSKEIAETEITLLKQEKMRLQSKVEGALKASESAQALLHSQLENSQELLLKEDEFKSLQLQVREINLLRESNIQLREENKHNFEERQKFCQEAQKAKVEIDKLENSLKQRETEFDALQSESELLKIEISDLKNRNAEILESYKGVNTTECEQMKEELEQIKDTLAQKLELIMKLEQDLINCHEELSEKEKKLNDALIVEANLKQDFDKQKKHLLVWKNKYQSLTKEKEELNSKNEALTKEIEDLKIINHAIMKEKEELNSKSQVLAKEKEDVCTKIQALTKEKDESISKVQALSKEKEEMNFKNQALLKQIEDFKSGRKVSGESEQSKKEQEKDARIQILEKSLEKTRDDIRNERQTRKKSQMTMIDLANRINMDKQKVEDELQKHKTAVSIILEKAGVLASQLPSGSSLDERTTAYFRSVSSFEAAAVSFNNDIEGPQLDNSAASADLTGQQIPIQQTKLPTKPHSKSAEEGEKASSSGKTIVEARRPGRRFVRPSLEKQEDPTTDTEITGMETSTSTEGKENRSSLENRSSTDISVVPPTGTRKRLTPSDHEIPEGPSAHDEVNVASARPPSNKRTIESEFSDAEAPSNKRVKESEFSGLSEAYVLPPHSSEKLETVPLEAILISETSEIQVLQSKDNLEQIDKLPSASNEEDPEMGKEDVDSIPIVNNESEEQFDVANPEEDQYERDLVHELSERPSTPDTADEPLDQAPSNEESKEILCSAIEGAEDDKREGDMMQVESEQQQDDAISEEGQLGYATGDGAGSGDDADDTAEFASPIEQGALDPVNASTVTDEDVAEDSDKRNNNSIDQGTLGSAESPEISTGAHEDFPIATEQNVESGQSTSNASAETGESQPARSSRTISITETARRNARLRQARMADQQPREQPQEQPPNRAQRPPFRRDLSRGRGRGGRG